MGIAERMFARCGDVVDLQVRLDTAGTAGGVDEVYTSFVASLPARVIEVGSQHNGNEQTDEGVTHVVTIAERIVLPGEFILDESVLDSFLFTLDGGGEQVLAEYILCTARAGTASSERYRIHNMRLVGPVGLRFREIFCEELKRGV